MKHDLNSKFKSAQKPDGKPGRELALRAEVFFRLDFIHLLFGFLRCS
jgi:hypothetical protein